MIFWKRDVYPSAIYIHWPFCRSKCFYCDFISFVNKSNEQDLYVKALKSEIKEFANFLNDAAGEGMVNTIFFGGGTPSLADISHLQEIVNVLRKKFGGLDGLKEFTLEANPRDVTEDKVKGWKRCGINRISLGVQLLNDAILKRVGRYQLKKDVYKAVDYISKEFNNFSIDLILGLPGVDEDIWFDTLEQVVNFPIKHISVYFLTLYEKTPLFKMVQRGEVRLPQEEWLRYTYKKTITFLAKNGFIQYEISNFARKGFECLHNLAYWRRWPYKGFGVSAASFDGYSRFIGVRRLERYLRIFYSGDSFEKFLQTEKLSKQQQFWEHLMLGMRCRNGVYLHDVLYLLKNFPNTNFLEELKLLESEGFISYKAGKIKLTLKGMFLENEVILRLLP